MGILSNINRERNNGSTKGFYFGAPEAEGENKEGQSLLNYFYDYLEILPLLTDGRFIFTGRKGAGKSAIAKFIKDSSEKSTDSYSYLTNLHDIELEKIIQTPSISFFENKEALILEWLILINVIKMIIRAGTSKYTNEYTKLKNFIDRNSGIVNIEKYEVTEIIKENGGEVNIMPLQHAFGGILKNYFTSKTQKAPFYKLIPPLKEIVVKILKFEVNKDLEFWLMFDDLDITFKANTDKQDVITELIRISKRYNNEYFLGTKAKVIIFLRDDIKKIIEGKYPDTGKIFSSYEMKISWYDHDSFKVDESSTTLKSFINRRISLNFEKYKIKYNKQDPWESLIEDDPFSYQGKSSFKYVLDFTFYRPRDFVLLFSTLGQKEYQVPITPKVLKMLLKKYIHLNITEIKNELSLNFSEIEKNQIFNYVFPHIIRNYNLSLNKFKEFLTTLNFTMSPESVVNLLIQYNLIAFKAQNGHIYFTYRDGFANDVELQAMAITLPKCIYHFYNEIQ